MLLVDGTIKKQVLIEYTSPLKTAGEVRKLAVSMHFAAYNGLGTLYKIRHNYYGNAAKMAWTHMPSKVKYPMAIGLAAMALSCVRAVLHLLQ